MNVRKSSTVVRRRRASALLRRARSAAARLGRGRGRRAGIRSAWSWAGRGAGSGAGRGGCAGSGAWARTSVRGAAKARTSTVLKCSVAASGSTSDSGCSGLRSSSSLAYRRSIAPRPDSSRMAVEKRSVGRASFSSSCLRSHIGTR
nr:hypothetical protein [Streptomyces tsukubensis]